ncbi:YiiX/YebB-like N1pC/P60 family cysteine hydrolase [Myroides indicus]|uniref:Permuted papain-like amidase YaeF/Yiix C92 family enzyme n=1 Tax=Myroides indicus TaxID=1323422 RepID=A0A4V6Q0R7_9FLAO|nr:YiiX/YebB-like N1pC/P60 family cysteine hydrolase [Myroides indicus]TDS61485.1 permuted papain-like amidase YaeF/Yiix C92 family enzyme [Myroides indicus]
MKIFRLALLLLFSLSLSAQKTTFKEGDFIFQNIDCGPLCDAINEVTEGYGDLNFNHIGMVIWYKDQLHVVEATYPQVCVTPIEDFLNKTSATMYLGRLLPKYESLIPKAKFFALEQVGIPYDDNYLYDNGKYYCSELIHDAFKAANDNTAFFKMYPMTYKSKYTGEFFPVWLEYFKKLDQPVPEGLPGCNPAGLSLSEKITIVGAISQ